MSVLLKRIGVKEIRTLVCAILSVLRRCGAGCASMVFVFAILLFAGVCEAQSEQTKRILILNSYHKEFAWTDDQTSAIKETLTSEIDNLELYVEYMDTKRLYSPEYLKYLRHIYHLDPKFIPRYEESPTRARTCC